MIVTVPVKSGHRHEKAKVNRIKKDCYNLSSDAYLEHLLLKEKPVQNGNSNPAFAAPEEQVPNYFVPDLLNSHIQPGFLLPASRFLSFLYLW